MKADFNGGVFVSTYFSYKDALMQAYTLPYVRLIRESVAAKFPVYLLSVEKREDRLTAKERKTITVQLESEGIRLVSLPYYRFGLGLLLWIPLLIRLSILILRKDIRTIHAWCMAGGVPGYLLSLLTGRQLILDSFEPHAEVMLETSTWRSAGLKFRIFFELEKRMARRAVLHISCTEDMKSYSTAKYGVTPVGGYVKPACVDLVRFDIKNRKNPTLVRELGLEGKIIAVYAGKFGGLYLEQEVFDLCRAAFDRWGDKFRLLLLTREPDERVNRWAGNAGLPAGSIIKRFVPHAEVNDYIGLGDFGLAPYAPVPSRKHAAPIKNAEYWALGLPVIITSGIADDSELVLSNRAGCVLSSQDKSEYERCIGEIDALLQEDKMEAIYARIRPSC